MELKIKIFLIHFTRWLPDREQFCSLQGHITSLQKKILMSKVILYFNNKYTGGNVSDLGVFREGNPVSWDIAV
jgi:hypothetical protein